MISPKIQNHSSPTDWEVARWFHPRFLADHVDLAVVLPDVCPGGIIPNGTAALVRGEWLETFQFSEAIGDIGCAMSWAPVELEGGWMTLRKGVTHSPAGSDVVIASSFDDVITIGRAKESIRELCDSMSHGTGRRTGRGDAKGVDLDDEQLRRRIIIPRDLPAKSWRLEAPVHYRHSSEVIPLVSDHFEVTLRLTPVAFMGGF